jgi:hypothetical protein
LFIRQLRRWGRHRTRRRQEIGWLGAAAYGVSDTAPATGAARSASWSLAATLDRNLTQAKGKTPGGSVAFAGRPPKPRYRANITL